MKSPEELRKILRRHRRIMGHDMLSRTLRNSPEYKRRPLDTRPLTRYLLLSWYYGFRWRITWNVFKLKRWYKNI